MDTGEIRKENLRRLIADVGSVKVLAERADTPASWLSAMASDKPQRTPKGTIRGIGTDLARKLEIAGKKPHGWMDQPHKFTERQTVWIEKFGELPEEAQEKVLEYMELLAQAGAKPTDPDGSRKKPVKSAKIPPKDNPSKTP